MAASSPGEAEEGAKYIIPFFAIFSLCGKILFLGTKGVFKQCI